MARLGSLGRVPPFPSNDCMFPALLGVRWSSVGSTLLASRKLSLLSPS